MSNYCQSITKCQSFLIVFIVNSIKISIFQIFFTFKIIIKRILFNYIIQLHLLLIIFLHTSFLLSFISLILLCLFLLLLWLFLASIQFFTFPWLLYWLLCLPWSFFAFGLLIFHLLFFLLLEELITLFLHELSGSEFFRNFIFVVL